MGIGSDWFGVDCYSRRGGSYKSYYCKLCVHGIGLEIALLYYKGESSDIIVFVFILQDGNYSTALFLKPATCNHHSNMSTYL